MERIWLECGKEDGFARYGTLFLVTYAFFSRLPSEAVPITVGRGSGGNALYKEGNDLVLDLRCRKNKPAGSTLRRGCWCRESAVTCPLHVLGGLVDSLPFGSAPFSGISAASAVGVLRRMLRALEVEKALENRTHDLRKKGIR